MESRSHREVGKGIGRIAALFRHENAGRNHRLRTRRTLFSQLLHLRGVRNVVPERQSRDYVLGRLRAGVIERGAVELLREAQAHQRLDREGQIQEGIGISFGGRRYRVDFKALTGSWVTVYGQTEITRDLFAVRDAMGGPIVHDAEDMTLHGVECAMLSIDKTNVTRRIDRAR